MLFRTKNLHVFVEHRVDIVNLVFLSKKVFKYQVNIVVVIIII